MEDTPIPQSYEACAGEGSTSRAEKPWSDHTQSIGGDGRHNFIEWGSLMQQG